LYRKELLLAIDIALQEEMNLELSLLDLQGTHFPTNSITVPTMIFPQYALPAGCYSKMISFQRVHGLWGMLGQPLLWNS